MKQTELEETVRILTEAVESLVNTCINTNKRIDFLKEEVKKLRSRAVERTELRK